MKICIKIAFWISLLIIAGCPQKRAEKSVPPAGLAGAQAPETTNEQGIGRSLVGTVQELTIEQGVSYLLLEEESGKKTWVALINTPVKIGDRLTVDGQVEMKNFFSKALQRSFASIFFGKVAAVGIGEQGK